LFTVSALYLEHALNGGSLAFISISVVLFLVLVSLILPAAVQNCNYANRHFYDFVSLFTTLNIIAHHFTISGLTLIQTSPQFLPELHFPLFAIKVRWRKGGTFHLAHET
jgi:hypothetical protein